MIKLKPSVFFRYFNDFTLISNQSTKQDFVLDVNARYFLEELSDQEQNFNDILKRILSKYAPEYHTQIKQDLEEFLLFLKDNEIIEYESPAALKKSAPAINNINSNTQLFLREYFKKHPHLLKLQIEITNACNEKCIHCYIPKNKKINYIDFDLFKNTVDQLKEMNTIALTLTGGECLLHKDFEKMCRYAVENDLMVDVLSNLTLLNDKHIALFKELNIKSIQTSLYSTTPEIHDQITRINGSCQKTKDAIEKLKRENINVTISCPIMQINHNTYKDVIEYGKSLNIKVQSDYILFGACDGNTTNLSDRLTLAQAKKFLKDNIDAIPPIRDTNNIEESFCPIAIDFVTMDSYGNVYPCPALNINLGNIKENSLKDIFYKSPKINYLRNLTLSKFPKCQKCKTYEYCSRCLGRNYNTPKHDIFDLCSYTCAISKEITNIKNNIVKQN